ncbi:MAG: tRNA lysidine(34) synthetase TilS [Alphaproteobacteria bacterium]|nr:tRNA lysidine(34) synthetase TilS [Alphaproteobacteria bacterium]MBV9968315.1 tRNA lysidine(34) synthetase TilS [Alphaproteobacteria bacterium]
MAELSVSLAAIGGFEAQPFIAVAVSGGPDSLALTILAERWARERRGYLTALTVDHRLRPESADEARTVGEWLEARGIEHHVLVWGDPKPKTGIQEAARDARYRLLAEWCISHGCLHLLTAHHREDQIETHLIRKRAGSGVDGLAGMPAVREMSGLRLVRPLLTVPKARLFAFLAAEEQPFLSDPSNRDPAYERARIRRRRMDEACAASLAAGVRDYGRQRVQREQELDRVLASAVSLHPAGFAAVDPALLGRIDPKLAETMLARIALCIGGAAYPLRRERVARLRAGLAERPERARTLAGCRFVPWRGRFLVIRELAAASPPSPVAAGCLWDRRFAVTAPPTPMPGIVLGYLGQFETTGRERGFAEPPESDLPRLLYPVLPALWGEPGLIAAPHLGYFRAAAKALPTIVWHPVNPLSPIGFTVV